MILYVEDSDGECALFAEAMRSFPGVHWDCLHTVAEGVAWMEAHGSDATLFLFDLLLPNGTGYELMRAASQHAPGVPFVVVTGSSSNQFDKVALRAGAREVVEKSGRQVAEMRRIVRRWHAER